MPLWWSCALFNVRSNALSAPPFIKMRRQPAVSLSQLWVFFRPQVTQEICDPSRVFRLLGSDRWVQRCLIFTSNTRSEWTRTTKISQDKYHTSPFKETSRTTNRASLSLLPHPVDLSSHPYYNFSAPWPPSSQALVIMAVLPQVLLPGNQQTTTAHLLCCEPTALLSCCLSLCRPLCLYLTSSIYFHLNSTSQEKTGTT